ncbi:hypothetical protein ZIOFF_041060 [Zingiber officinale]|uniref:Uncharacterized protein n=1 Tax=Zingiber officinale TaxID=94328 RepID=A0A8J5KVR1_ZINOF|nr:hypothetical protein ZIOFF_041060 [Zingiber officinale]
MKSPSSSSSSKRRPSSGHRNNNNNASIAVWEENTMAILDSSGIKDSRDVHDDRTFPHLPFPRFSIIPCVFLMLFFSYSCRALLLGSCSICVARVRVAFCSLLILTDCNSLELAMASYQLLIELDKVFFFFFFASVLHYPRVYLSKSDELESSSSDISKLVVVKEAWSPFNLASGSEEGAAKDSCYLFDPLGSRKLNFKSVVRDCMSILLRRCHHSISNNVQQLRNSENTCCSQSDENSKAAVAIAISQLEKETCVSIQKFVGLVIELDVVRKEADSLGQTSRVDGLRLPITEFIVEELTYNKDNFAPLLLVFSEPKWKLEIILLYFSKYLIKPSVRTRRSNDTPVDVTLESVLSNFSTTASTKNIVKKVSSDLASLLLAHAFQACLSLIRGPRQITNPTELIGANLLEICSKLISAIKIIRRVDGKLEITSFTKEALFTAAMILKTNA